jgi:hypothetical protein
MPVVVACQCGQRFAAEDRLVGQQVPCPVCGRVLSIGTAAPAPPPTPPPAAPGIYVACGCGQAFLAPSRLRGKSVKCPNCGGPLVVPAEEVQSLGPQSPAVIFGGDPFVLPPPPPPKPALHPDRLVEMLPRLAVGAVALLVTAIIVTSLVNWIVRPSAEPKLLPTANVPRKESPQAQKKRSTTPPKAVATPPPPPSAENAAAKAPETTPADSPGETTAVARLPAAAQAWHQQPGANLAGLRRAGPSETPAAHFSWLTSLLPFLGHTKTYERIDFSQSVTKGNNLHVGCTVIPEFLNPADDRQQWKGHPLNGMALSHFAGMSGVEDSRNVVAAKLPRSDPRAGVFGYDDVATPSQITDGTSQTAMIVGTGALPNPWILGGGGTVRGAREPLFGPTSGLGTHGLEGSGTVVVMADGSVRRVTGDIDPQVFRAMCTTHGADSVDLERSTKQFSWDSLKKEATQ